MTQKELKELFEKSPNIADSGSVKGMIELGYWKKDDIIVKYNGYYYNLSMGVKR